MADNPSIQSQEEKTPQKAAAEKAPEVAVEDDSDPDFDDLDDVLDQFSAANTQSAPKHQSEPTPSGSGPGRPESDLPDIHIPHGQAENESETDFMARLTAEMSTVLSQMSEDPAADAANPEDLAKMGRELEEFTEKMEAEGIKPEDILKAILGEEKGRRVSETAKDERERRESEVSKSRDRKNKFLQESNTTDKSSTTATGTTTTTTATGSTAAATTFEDTIRRTIERIEDSSAKATDATKKSNQKPQSEEDMLAEMLRALDSEAGSGGDDESGGGDNLSKMFLGMMEQLTNKEMLYEPMKELDIKYPQWLKENKSKLKSEEYSRFTRQQIIVKEIVKKYEEKDYTDEDPKCREYIWEKMQKMQDEGAPPEDLIANPFPGMGLPSFGGGGAGGGEGIEGLDEGCPTQ